MGMQTGAPGALGSEPMIDINTTPLIDVMLVLIIMLIITIPVQLHAVNLNMPVPSTALPDKPPEAVRLDIAADGSVAWNGEPLASHAALEERLAQLATRTDPPELHLRPDRQAEYAAVAAVLASAQRLGLQKLGLVGNEQYLQP